MKHLFDNSHNNVYTKEYINLSVGAPGRKEISFGCIRKLTKHLISRSGSAGVMLSAVQGGH